MAFTSQDPFSTTVRPFTALIAYVGLMERVLDCTPNVSKSRVGREYHFHAARDIEPGEELCISYISLDETVGQRQTNLKENWFFDCICARCQDDGNTTA